MKQHRNRPGAAFLPRLVNNAGLIGILMLCLGAELVLLGADLGWWGGGRWRALAYHNGGFWVGLLRDWRPNYPAQPWAMFVTYGFLHSGPVHLAVNMITLVSLGRAVQARLGQGRFLAAYALSVLGGALGFALLSSSPQPMVGASGALFGLAGVILAQEYGDLRAARARPWPVVWAVLLLLALNVVMYWAMDGLLAWQTHLGGFVAGWLFGMFCRAGRGRAGQGPNRPPQG
ncbi:MAG: rhomboid family intramembrane serine protease [Gemmobacter sp.]